MLRDYAVCFARRRAQPGLLHDHAVHARAFRSGAFDARCVFFTCRTAFASVARSWPHGFFGSHFYNELPRSAHS